MQKWWFKLSVRIIAGKFRGINIEVPDSARPTLSRSRQALFDSLVSIQNCFFDDKTVLDCFAGSGILGIEAFSRGASNVVFVEQNTKAVKIIAENIEKLKINKDTSIYSRDFFKIKTFGQIMFDLVFIDPPYGKFSTREILQKLISLDCVKKSTFFIIETDVKLNDFENDLNENKIINILEKKIGNSFFSILTLE